MPGACGFEDLTDAVNTHIESWLTCQVADPRLW
jgi:hypothetical protein